MELAVFEIEMGPDWVDENPSQTLTSIFLRPIFTHNQTLIFNPQGSLHGTT